MPEEVQAVVVPGLGQFHPPFPGGGSAVDLGFGFVGRSILEEGRYDGLPFGEKDDVRLAGVIAGIGIVGQGDGMGVAPPLVRSDLDPVRRRGKRPLPRGRHFEELASLPAGHGGLRRGKRPLPRGRHFEELASLPAGHGGLRQGQRRVRDDGFLLTGNRPEGREADDGKA